MKEKKKLHPDLMFMIIMSAICILPALLSLFYKKMHFVDLGLMITAILIVIFIIPIYNARKRYIESQKVNN